MDDAQMIPATPQAVSSRLGAILERFSEQHVLLQAGSVHAGITFVALGTIENVEVLTMAARAATARLQTYFGGHFAESFPGLKVYFADGITQSGGEALASENAIIIDATKAKLTVSQAEQFLVNAGSLDAGDWTAVANADSPSAEMQIVHEIGHLLEAKAHGAEGVAFKSLSPQASPTKYGREAGGKAEPGNEDYAESFVYEVYGAAVDERRGAILRADVQRVAGLLPGAATRVQ